MSDLNPIRQRAAVVLSDVLQCPVPPDEPFDFAASGRVDSLKQLEITLTLEDEFGIRLTPTQMAEMQSLDAMTALITTLLAGEP